MMNTILLAITVAFAAETSVPPPVVTDNAPSAQTEAAPLSLGDCIRFALANSPEIESAEFDRELVEAKLYEAKGAYFLPDVKLQALGGPVPDVPDGSGPEGDFPRVDTDLTELGLFFRARVEAIQPLFTFGKLSGLKRAAERGVHAKKAQEAVVRNMLIHRIKEVYFGLSYLYSLQSFIEDMKDKATRARDRVQEELDSHSPEVTDIDLMRLQVFLSETERRMIELKSAISLGLTSLGILMGKGANAQIQIADHSVRFHETTLKPIDYYLSRAKVARPEIQQLNDNVAIRRSLIGSAKADFFPMFFLGGFYQYGIAPGRQDVDNPFLRDDFNMNSGGVALGFEQKLSFHMTDAKREQANAEYRKALADQKRALMGIEIEIRKAHADAVARQESVKAAETGFKAGRSWVMATTLNFGVGVVPVKDLLESFVAYSKVRVSFLDTIHEFDNSLADLSRVVGEEITDLKY